jgi:S1-C subfamily serine protease
MFSKLVKKLWYSLSIVVAVIILGGVGGALIDAYTPNLASVPGIGSFGFFKKLTERVTIINKTEQVIIPEDNSVEKVISQPATAVVTLIVLPDDNKGVKKELPTTLSGVLLTNDGLIVTYSELPLPVSGSHFTVLLFDGTTHTADLIGTDAFTNLSYVHLNNSTNTPAIALANSDDARVGKKLIAIGNSSAEYQNRLAVGTLGSIDHTFNLSGKTVSSSEKLEGVLGADFVGGKDFIGGPVIGLNGEMVGLLGSLMIDNSLHTFLIPSNVVRESLDRATAGTLAKRPALGVYYLSITKTLALEMNLARDHGALIYSPSGKTGLALLADSKAQKAGLQVGDIITALNGQEVTLDNSLSLLLGHLNVGDALELTFLRGGEVKKVSLTL